MPALVAGIHDFLSEYKTWMSMTVESVVIVAKIPIGSSVR